MAENRPDPLASVDERGDWLPGFEGQRPPFGVGNEHRVEAGNELALKHGVYSERDLGPLRAAFEAQLAATSPAFANADDSARRVLAAKMARIEQGYRWLDKHGAYDEHGQQRPVLEQIRKDENAAQRYMRELGMTTLSRAELRLDQAQAFVAIAEVQEVVAAAFRAAAQFVPKDRRDEFRAEMERLTSRVGEVGGVS